MNISKLTIKNQELRVIQLEENVLERVGKGWACNENEFGT